MTRIPTLMIHGGAGRLVHPSQDLTRLRKKIRKILKLAHAELLRSNAMEAVVYAVQLMEDDPDFNAGTGSQLQGDGKARLTASVMDGKRERFAAVINLEGIKNPVLVAQALLHEKNRVLSGEGALRFARENGFKQKDTRTPAAIRRWKKHMEEKCDTVGACALDNYGHLASATSTGGRGFERPGRVSDSGMPVANHADVYCAISVTGIGEDIIDHGVAIRIATRARDHNNLKQAFQKTFREIEIQNRYLGAIGIDLKGKSVHQTTTDFLIWGCMQGSSVLIF